MLVRFNSKKEFSFVSEIFFSRLRLTRFSGTFANLFDAMLELKMILHGIWDGCLLKIFVTLG